MKMYIEKIGTLAWLSICYVVVGIISLIFNKEYNYDSLNELSFAVGILLIISGVVIVVFYLARKNYLKEEKSGFMIGSLMFFVGLYATFSTQEFARVFSILIALCILADSVYKMQLSFSLLSAHNKHWWILLLLGILTAVLSMSILMFPFNDLYVMDKNFYTYLILIADGIINLLIFAYMRYFNKSSNSFN